MSHSERAYWRPRPNCAAWIPALTKPIALPCRIVHLWRVRLADRTLLETAQRYLSTDELQRANGYGTTKLRDNFMTCRASLREILSRYLTDIAPHDIRLGQQQQGKPMLIGHSKRLTFNVAHTEDLGLIAVANGMEVGVDIEKAGRPISNVARLMEKRFTDGERREIIGLSHDAGGQLRLDSLQTNFLRLWTRKEAFVKCTGEGISRGLQTFEMNLDQEDPRILSVCGMRGDDKEWSLYDIDVGEGYVAALVTATSDRVPVCCLDWNA